MSGEDNSRAFLRFPGVQELLIQTIFNATGKPIVLIIQAGRPLIFPWSVQNIPSILYAWFLGSEAGNSLADILFGAYSPSGKLPVSFPRAEGQIPVYYDHKNTGRPSLIRYLDLPITPEFPFGFGLSYTTFNYSNLVLSQTQMTASQQINVSLQVKNVGTFPGAEVVQMYTHDQVATVTRPVKELKDFARILLQPGSQ